MPSDQLDIPALPILLPLGLALMIGSWVLLRRHGMLTAWRLGAAWLAGWYAVAVLGATLLPMHLAWGAEAGGPMFYRIILVPLTTMRVSDFLLNIVMMLPLATLLWILAGVRERSRVVLTGFLISLTIETIQAITDITLHGTRWADVNDIISNTLGAFIGFLLLRRLLRFGPFRRLAAHCAFRKPEIRTPKAVRWPPSS